MGQDCPKCKETPSHSECFDFEFFGFNVSIWVPWSPLGPKKSWYIGRIIQIHKIWGEKQVAVCSISKISLKHFLTFLTSGPLADKQQKRGEKVENIKFSLDTQLIFFVFYMFTRFLLFKRWRAWGFFTFLAILAYCVAQHRPDDS